MFKLTSKNRQVYRFLPHVSIAYCAERCISHDWIRPSVRHSPVSCQNDSSYNHRVFTV